ncbi:MAG: hypothetical protein R2813_00120 [Flavobacteriales bacterium]
MLWSVIDCPDVASDGLFLLMQQVIDKTLSIDQAGAFIAIMLLLIMPVSRLAGVSHVPGLMQRQLEQLFAVFDLPQYQRMALSA